MLCTETSILPGSPMSEAVTSNVIDASVSRSRELTKLSRPVVRLILNCDNAEKGLASVSLYLTIPPTLSLSEADICTHNIENKVLIIIIISFRAYRRKYNISHLLILIKYCDVTKGAGETWRLVIDIYQIHRQQHLQNQ